MQVTRRKVRVKLQNDFLAPAEAYLALPSKGEADPKDDPSGMSRKRSRRPSRPSRSKPVQESSAAVAHEAETEHDSGVENGLEPERDSGVESSPVAAHDDESELERHFFSQPPAADDATYVTSASLAPSSRSLHPEAEAEEESAAEPVDDPERFRLHREKLRKRVLGALGGATALLLLGLVLNGRAEAQRRAENMGPAPVVTTIAAAVPVADEGTDLPSLLRRAEQELDAGHGQQAAELARSALALAPHDAQPYLLLAGALQDLGKFDEAREAFRDCVKHAQSGAVASCRSFAEQ
jgi:tetratricopeptide (TPR) repeat protein